MRLAFRLTIPGLAVLVALAFAATAQPAVTFVFKGKGWGHGIGLSQYGAQGLAQNGRTYPQILRPLLQRHDPGEPFGHDQGHGSSRATASHCSSAPMRTSTAVAAPSSAGTWVVAQARAGR